MDAKIVCITCNSANVTTRSGKIINENGSDAKCFHYRCSDCQTGWLQNHPKEILYKVDF